MKSKFKIFGGFGILIGILLVIFIIFPILITRPYDQAKNGDLPLWFYIFWLIVGASFVLYQVFTRVNFIEIKDGKVYYSNFLLRKKKEINFKQIDGYERKVELAEGGIYELITLRKGEKSLLKISAFYYSNFDELKKYIQSELKEIDKMNKR